MNSIDKSGQILPPDLAHRGGLFHDRSVLLSKKWAMHSRTGLATPMNPVLFGWKSGRKDERKNMNHKYVRTLALCLLIAAVVSITACTNNKKDSHADINGTMNIEFGENGMIRNGTEHRTYQVEKGQKGILSIRISKVSGRLDIDFFPVEKKDKPSYTGRDLDSASFDVIVEDPGEYQVCFSATEFVGDYGISWRTEDNTGK